MKLDLQLTGVRDPIAQQNFWIFQKLFESGNFMTTRRLDFLLQQVEDPVAQENFWRIKKLFEAGGFSSELDATAAEETAEEDECVTFLNVLSVEGSSILEVDSDQCVLVKDADEPSVSHLVTGSLLKVADV